MKTWNLIRSAALVAVVAATVGTAQAGSITTPATPTKYAAEGLTAATTITLAPITYTMGVPRAAAANYTLIYTPGAGVTFNPASCIPANLSGTIANTTFSTKVASTTVCSFDATVIAPGSAVGQTIVFSNLQLASHPLATAGSSAQVSVNLKDPGETSQVDNAGPLTVTAATSVNAINIYATRTSSDKFTIADVNNGNGPLRGFLPDANAPIDTATTAAVGVTLDNNTQNAVKPDGVTLYDFTTTTGTAVVTVTDSKNFGGLAPGKFCLDLNTNFTPCEAGEVMTVVGNTATLTVPSAAFPAVGSTESDELTFQADGTTSLGTGRTFSLSSVINPGTGPGVAVGASHASSDPNGINATFWIWGANAIQLWMPFVSNASGWISRFIFMNTGPAVSYTASCTAEGATNPGPAITGTINSGTTKIENSQLCAFSGPSRGSVIFTINAAAGNIHGQYVLVNSASGGSSVTEMTRPYAQATF